VNANTNTNDVSKLYSDYNLNPTPSDCWDVAATIADTLYGGDDDVFWDRYTTCLDLCQ